MKHAAPKRKCRAAACTNVLKPGYLVCPSCWRATPRHLKTTFQLAVRRNDREALLAAADSIIKGLNDDASPLVPE